MDLAAYQKALGHTFTEPAWAEEALTHGSAPNEPVGAGRTANQRLAQVGDAVVGLAIRAHLFRENPTYDKGDITKAAVDFVTDPALAAVAERLGLARHLLRGGSIALGEENTTVQADLYEASIGAVFFDAGYKKAAELVERHLFT